MDVVYGHGIMKRENMAEAAFIGMENTIETANTSEGEDMTGVSAVNNDEYEFRALFLSLRPLLRR